MAHLELRTGVLDRIKEIHGFKSDAALAAAIGIGFRTLTRVKSDPSAIQADMIAGICTAFGYSPSDIVQAVETTPDMVAA